MIRQPATSWRTCKLCGNTGPIRTGDDMCGKSQRVAKSSVRREEREWLGRYVEHPNGSGQVVGLAPRPGRVWVCDDDQVMHDCDTAELVRRDQRDYEQVALW